MARKIFRQESLDKFSSPDQLNNYVKIAALPIWIILIAILLFIIGLIIWGFCGSIDGVSPFSLLFK
jgi:hypothetical protein